MATTKYKDSGIPWIGEIPSDWEVLPIKRVKDQTHPYPIGDGDHGSIKPDDYRDKGIPYIRVQNMSWGGPIIMDNIAYISEEVNAMNRKSELHPNDILVAKTGATIGKTCIIPKNMPKANTTSSVGKITVGKDYSSKFIFYLLGSEVCIRQMWLKAGQKSAQPGFNIDELVDFKIPISKDSFTQQRIADFLDRKCAEIDELAALQETMIAELKRYKQSVITEAVTKGLDKNVKMKDSGVEWIGEIPEGWEVCRLKNIIATIRSGVSVNAELIPATNDEYGVLKTSSVSKNIFDIKENKRVNIEEYGRVSCPVKADTIIVSRMNTPELVGATGYCEYDVDNIFLPDRLWQVEFNRTVVNTKYSWYFLINNITKQYYSSLSSGTSSSMQNISQSQFENAVIILSPLAEQQAIADYLDEKCSEIDELIAIKQQKIEQLKEYKKSVIFEYVTGKKEVQR